MKKLESVWKKPNIDRGKSNTGTALTEGRVHIEDSSSINWTRFKSSYLSLKPHLEVLDILLHADWYHLHQGIIRLIFQELESKKTVIIARLSSLSFNPPLSPAPPDWWKPTSHFLRDCGDVLGEMPAFSWLICLLCSNQCHSGREMPCVLNGQLSHMGRFYELGLPQTCTNTAFCWWDSLGVKNKMTTEDYTVDSSSLSNMSF